MATRRTTTKARPAKPAAPVEEIEDLELDDVEEEEVEEVKPVRKAPARRKPAAKKAPEPEPEEDDLDEDEEDEEPEPAPKKRGRPAAAKKAAADEKPRAASKRPEIEFGTAQLVDHVNVVCGTAYKAYDLRVLLRKMAKNNELDREVGEDRSRYSFSGPKDPVVIALVKKIKSGAVEESKKEAIDTLKAKVAAKKGDNVTSIKKKRGRPAKPAVADEEEFDDDDVDDLE